VNGLTSIHESSISENEEIKSSTSTLDGKKVFEAQAKIDSLKKREKTLLDSISSLEKSVSSAGKNRSEILAEIKKLKSYRVILTREISELFNILNLIKGSTDKFTGEVKSFSEDKMASLTNFSSSIKKDYGKRLDRLKKMSKSLDKREVFLVELADYMSEFAVICEATRRLNASKTAENEKVATDVALLEQKAKKLLKLAKEDRMTARSKLEKVNLYHKRIEEAKDYLENKKDIEEKRLNKKEKDLIFREKAVDSSKKVFESLQEILFKREKKLNDKEETLKRSAKRLGVV